MSRKPLGLVVICLLIPAASAPAAELAWATTHDGGPGSTHDIGESVDVDGDGNAIVAGFSYTEGVGFGRILKSALATHGIAGGVSTSTRTVPRTCSPRSHAHRSISQRFATSSSTTAMGTARGNGGSRSMLRR